jgi:hypothetical protein
MKYYRGIESLRQLAHSCQSKEWLIYLGEQTEGRFQPFWLVHRDIVRRHYGRCDETKDG